MKIDVIGPGCPFCKTLYKRVNEVMEENNMEADVEHLTNFKSWIKHFPMTPVLIVDGEIRHRGKWLPKKEKILQLLTRA
ncbi:MAG: thioredoxin family protein [Desulfobacterales bacterium]|nr:thioredoxin family protein [Desulfobacterales bacterium]